jgi:hypothetical protein
MTSCALIIQIVSNNSAILHQITVDLYPEFIPHVGHKIHLNEVVAGKDLMLIVNDVRHCIAKDQKDNFTTVIVDQLIVEYDAVYLVVKALESYFDGKIQSSVKNEEDWHKDAVEAFNDEQHSLHHAIKKKLEDNNKEFNLYNAVEIYQSIIELPEAIVR